MKSFLMSLALGLAVTACRSANPQAELETSAYDGKLQRARFEPWLAVIDKAVYHSSAQHSTENVAMQLVSGPSRAAAFHLQALGRIYQDIDPWFKTLRKEFKTMEDTIGEFDKWNNLLKNPDIKWGLEAKVLAEKGRKNGLIALEKFLTDQKWVGEKVRKTDQIRRSLAKIKWETPMKDRTYAVEYLASELSNLDQNKYQFESLEEGLGLHQLRKDMRWVNIEMVALNGLIARKPVSCPTNAFQDIANSSASTSKYAVFPQPTKVVPACYVPECLIIALAHYINKLGEIKDEAEARLNTSNRSSTPSDVLPEDLKNQASMIYEVIKKENLFLNTSESLKACIQ